MNNPGEIPIDVEEQRDWLMEHKKTTGHSWSDLARRTSIAAGTLSQFGPGSYKGDNAEIARKVYQFRQLLASQAEISVDAPDIPSFFMTPSARRFQAMMVYAQRGRIALIAAGPGTSKTTTGRHYQASVANVWMITLSPSTAGVNNMQIEVLAAMGEQDAVGTPQKLSRRIKDRVRNSGGLLIFDEAQHASEKSIEEIRSWHDATGIGICLMGNVGVLERMEGGSRKSAYAQIFSRVGMRHIQNLPLTADAIMLGESWGITEQKEIDFITKIAGKPGGLRSCTMVLELATMLAASENNSRNLAHMQDAWAQLSTRPLSV